MSIFQPSDITLEKYADTLVNFALNSGQGVHPGEVVLLNVPEAAKPLLIHLQKAVLKSGAHPIIEFVPDGISRDFFEIASSDQISFFPKHFLKGKVKQADHFLFILAETDLHELENIDPKKIISKRKSLKPYYEWRDKKEQDNKFTWTIGLYPTQAMASEAGLTLESCWQQVIDACFLDQEYPLQKWQQVFSEIKSIKDKLDHLKIKTVNIKSNNTDLNIGIGESRRWAGGDGRNIPSFEIFTSPNWREVNGRISFDQPLYRFGNIIKDIYLEFKNGKIIKATASQGQELLREMIKTKNADKIGEFSLTDNRFSRISKFMAETLYDENFGGEFGNTHIAIGASFKECYSGSDKLKKSDWNNLGFNDSAIHTDIVSTKDRVVTAKTFDDQEIVIYQNGQFTL